ncbi:MAG: hypothetical protein M5U26_24645 [Planctomycetota bacterium]|nr:hypothetical protein [Planctomycetota bacterium]
MKRAILLLLALALRGETLFAEAGESPRPAFTILFSAEAHAALLPCDCPLQPLGGVARRATLIKRFRERGPVLLLDAGGWAAGGLYDEESDGDPARDRLRSELMAQCMGLMAYSAVGWGDEEWALELRGEDGNLRDAYGQVLPQRVFTHWPDRDLPAKDLRLTWTPMDAGESRVGLLAVPDNEGRSTGVDFTTLRLLHPPDHDGREPEFALALAPVGEETAERLARESPVRLDLVLSGGRKASTRESWRAGATVIANFEYQVRKLGVAEVYRRPAGGAGGSPWDVRVRFVPLGPEIPDDPEIAALLAPHLETLKRQGKERLTLEFWTMSECPFCEEARADVQQVVEALGARVRFEPHFVVSRAPDGTFRALHGPRELEENKVQALIWKYYPEKFFAWLAWRKDRREAPWEDGARELGILRARIAGALATGEADAILEADRLLALRRQVQGTPTLVLGNRIYEGDLERLKLLSALCGMLREPHPEACAGAPKCFFDAQCRKRGFVGRCLDAGTPAARCDFSQPAVKVGAEVLVEPHALWSNHEAILEILVGYLPGLAWREIDPHTEAGRALVEQYGIERFPAYLLDENASTEERFAANLGQATAKQGERWLVKPQTSGAHRLANRERVRGRADLFVSRFTRNGQEAVDAALALLDELPDKPDLRIHDALYWQEDARPDGGITRQLAARGGRAELEDAALALAVRRLAPEKFRAYLKARGERRASLYWDLALKAVELDPAAVRKLAEGPEEGILREMEASADLLAALEAGGDIVLLGENCEVLPVRSSRDLRYFLERIGRRNAGVKQE